MGTAAFNGEQDIFPDADGFILNTGYSNDVFQYALNSRYCYSAKQRLCFCRNHIRTTAASGIQNAERRDIRFELRRERSE
ncbi:hypothetical protein D3C73_1524520 [compost metagenome]